MGKAKSQSSTTRKKEPHRAGVPEVPAIQSVLVEMAWQVAIPFMGFTLGGNWIDGQTETEPLFTIIGLFLGIASVYVIVKRLIAKHWPQQQDKESK